MRFFLFWVTAAILSFFGMCAADWLIFDDNPFDGPNLVKKLVIAIIVPLLFSFLTKQRTA